MPWPSKWSALSVASRRARGVPDLMTWLTEVFGGLGIDSAKVAGLSYGGWITWATASIDSRKVAAGEIWVLLRTASKTSSGYRVRASMSPP